MKTWKLWLVILIAALLLPPQLAAAQGTTLSLVPSAAAVKVGDTVHVDIRIDGASDLYAAEVYLAFSPALQVLDDDPLADGVQILPGSVFPRSDPSYIVLNKADNTAGTVGYAITLLAPETPIAGSGTLATIRFAARNAGTATVRWTYSQLANGQGMDITHTTRDLTIQIAEPGTPQQPSDRVCSGLINNGTMEADAYWQMPVTPHKARYTTVDKHGGARSVRLGIEPGSADVYSYSSAYQLVTIPANADQVTLKFWARRFTQETTRGDVDPTADLYDPGAVIEETIDWARGERAKEDYQEVLILSQGCYNWLATLMRTRSNDGVWTEYTYDVSTFAGQKIVVYFDVINDGDGQRSWMYVDDVQLEVCSDGSSCDELVSNRSFEWTGEWQHPTTPRRADYTTDAAHTGSRSMRVGVVPPTADVYSHSSAYQAINVPSGAVHPVLTFWYKAHSEEPARSNWKDYDWSSYDPAKIIAGSDESKSCCGQIDWQEMLLLDANYRLLSGGVVLRQVQNDGVWRQKTFDLSPYKGMTVVLYFNAINDGDGQRTWMYVDDVSVNLCGNLVRFEPANTQVGIGANFDAQVWVEQVENLYGFEATIRFDPAVLQVVDADPAAAGVQVRPGAWLPASAHIVANTADNAAGQITFAATLVAPAPALTGSGALVRIPFQARAAGATPLAFSHLRLVSANATALVANQVDGQVTVSSGQATVTGRVLLEGRSNHSGTTIQVTGGVSATTAADGSYTLSLPAGSYTLTMSRSSYLSQTTTVTTQAGGTVTVPQVTLRGGNINGDTRIDILDLVAVGAQFGSTNPNPPTADVNGDGVVDIMDIVLVAKNFS